MLKENLCRKIMENVVKLPEFEQKAAIWVIRNWKLAEAICKPETNISAEEVEEQLEKMADKGDYVGYALYTCMKIFLDKAEREKEREDIT